MHQRAELLSRVRSIDVIVTLCLCSSVAACGDPEDRANAADTADAPGAEGARQSAAASDKFPEPPSGYTRIVAPTLNGLTSGSDTTVCQYVQAPFDHDVDVLDVRGYQSIGGHHAVAFASTVDTELGLSRRCNDEDNVGQGGFLGGIGGEAGGGIVLPPGVAFRLHKGSSIMLNTHFINPTETTIDGHSVVDFKFAEVDEDRTIAAMFVNGSGTFQLSPHETTESVATCKLPKSMQFILFTNHMHEHGASAITEILRDGGSSELVHEDPTWTYEMQFKAIYSKWSVDEPLTFAAGDTVRTRCTWRNDSDQSIGFPREMCFGVGFFLSDGKSAPVCLDGQMLER